MARAPDPLSPDEEALWRALAEVIMILPRALDEQFLRDTGKAYFKFVVDQPADVAEVDALVTTLSLAPDRVLLMPQALTADEVLTKSRWLVETCKGHGYGYSPRLHILLWGAKRGV